MDIRTLCLRTYQDYVRTASIPNELRRSLRAHERVPRFIDNLADQFKRLTFEVKKETIEHAVRDMTRLFVANVQRQAEEKSFSSLKRSMIIREAELKARARALVDRVLDGGKTHVTQDQKGNTTERQTIIAEQII